MPDDYREEFATSGNGPRYDHSAAAAAEIMSKLRFEPDESKIAVYAYLLFIILEAMNNAEAELSGFRWEPGEN